MHLKTFRVCRNCRPTSDATTGNSSVNHFAAARRPARLRHRAADITVAIRRQEACLQLHSCCKFDAVARCERGVASVTGPPESTTQGDDYEVREHCESGRCRGRGGWTGGLYGYQAPPGGSGGSEGSAG